MTAFVLVHGAYHGAWCWYKLRPELEARGHEVVTFDLPAHGVDTTPPSQVSFDGYVDRIGAALDRVEEPVLVGHSMSGMFISQVAERRPDDIETLVYLTAYLPGDGESMLDLRSEASVLSDTFEIDEDRGVGWVPEEAIDEAFYGDCSLADRALARSLLRVEPMGPISTPVDLSEARFGSVRRVYVGCGADRAITPEQQREMKAAIGCDGSISLQASHSPFFSVPVETADALEAADDAR
jgi:pimeloyl-ACP methyl ester carboxylesterase